MDVTARERNDSAIAIDPALERGHERTSTRLSVANTGEQ
ncbi:hypothetical protein SAMN05421809_2511 [Natronorubrum daqingense]|uniref:Uncharacterized protein n=1 Tax=Natronorubrum daqingense TaxID=588898 RepID=A0A1N7E7K0_9EURY|nr:hypothetical protein SAMN05421809_2511 [Natronorubrum daqingense]